MEHKLYNKILKSILKGLNEAGIFDNDDILDTDDLTLDELDIAKNLEPFEEIFMRKLKETFPHDPIDHVNGYITVSLLYLFGRYKYILRFLVTHDKKIYINIKKWSPYVQKYLMNNLHIVKRKQEPFTNIDECFKWLNHYMEKYL